MARKVYRKAKRRRATGAAQQTGYGQKTKLDTSSLPHVYATVNTIPVNEFLSLCPLPAELAHLAPILRGPLGQALLDVILASTEEGLGRQQMESAVKQVVDFYAEEYHRCNTCYAWTNDFLSGGMIVDKRQFKITVICQRCAHLAVDGRATPSMTRNMQDHAFGDDEVPQ